MFCIKLINIFIMYIFNYFISGEQVTKCPTCGSKLLVELEEAPLPSTDNEGDPALTPPTIESSSTSPLKHSPSDCSIGRSSFMYVLRNMCFKATGELLIRSEGLRMLDQINQGTLEFTKRAR